MFRLASSTSRPLTFDLAREHLNAKPSPTERSLDAGRVKYLKDRIEAGFAVPFVWATARLNGEIYRVNGQHSSRALHELERFPDGLKVHFDEYEVDDRDGLALLFRQFDPRQSSRTVLDISGAYQGLTALEGLDRKSVKIGVDGVAWFRRNVEKVPVPSGDDRYFMLNETGLHDFLSWLTTGVLMGTKTREMEPQSVIAAMYSTHCTNGAEARVFWPQVARGGMQPGDDGPAAELDKLLRNHDDGTRRLKPGNLYQGSVFSWNAFRTGKTFKAVRYDTDKGFLNPIE